MKKVLFIVPGLGLGGTNPSLEALYSYIKNQYDLRVFAISHQDRYRSFLFDEVLLPQCKALSLLYTDFCKQRGTNIIIAFFYKIVNTFFRIFRVNLMLWVSRRAVKKMEEEEQYDSVVAYQEGFATVFGSLFHCTHKVAWIHCNYDKWLPKEKSEEELYIQYEKIVCVSKYTASVFAKRYPLLRERVQSIYNLVDIQMAINLGNQIIDDVHFLTNRFTIITAGRFNSVKRFREIPCIAAELKRKGLSFYWYILGKEDDKSEVLAFMSNLHDKNVEDCVQWLGGKSNPYPYYKASDLYVCISESEACPMVFVEAMLFGVPIVTTDFPSAYEFIDNNVNGYVVHLDELAGTISRMLTDNKLYERIKREVNIFSFDNEKLVNQFKEIMY